MCRYVQNSSYTSGIGSTVQQITVKLPGTYTTTFDDIVSFLRNTCEASKRLSPKEIEEAIDLVNELAFNGLTREVQQLVFPREEITNENILKLCILSGTKTLRGFRTNVFSAVSA